MIEVIAVKNNLGNTFIRYMYCRYPEAGPTQNVKVFVSNSLHHCFEVIVAWSTYFKLNKHTDS